MFTGEFTIPTRIYVELLCQIDKKIILLGNPIKIEFTKDDFRGYFIILNFGKIKSYQFKQSDIDELLNNGKYFNF